MTENDQIKIDSIATKLMKVFDTNKNGKLEYQEAISAFCILCPGSIQAKLKCLMLAYSEVYKEPTGEGMSEQDPRGITIRPKNLKKFMGCIFKLALCTSPELLLDYPIDKLAAQTAEKCLSWVADARGSDGADK